MFHYSKQRVENPTYTASPPLLPDQQLSPTAHQSLYKQPSMEEIFLFRWGICEGGIAWHNRRIIQCSVASIASDSNTTSCTEGNQIWQSCGKILICLERVSTPYFWEQWKSMLTATCHCYIFRTSDLNRRRKNNIEMFGSESPNLMRMKLKHSRKCFLTRTGFWKENMPVSLTSFYLSLHWRLRPALAFVWNLASYITAQMRSSIFHWQIPCLCLRYVVVQFSLDVSVNLQSSGA